MSQAPFRVASLDAAIHDRSQFYSGVPALDRYLREQVSQDIRRHVATCFVAVDDAHRVVGYYTLASASVPLLSLTNDVRRKLPRYPSIPAVCMGRLAVDVEFKRKGLGGTLLIDALRRAAGAEIAATVLVVDAKDDHAAAFYVHHGFIALVDAPLTLFLPLATVR